MGTGDASASVKKDNSNSGATIRMGEPSATTTSMEQTQQQQEQNDERTTTTTAGAAVAAAAAAQQQQQQQQQQAQQQQQQAGSNPTSYPEWAAAFQAYYNSGGQPPPGYYPPPGVSGPQPHPYMWGGQPMMPPYGTPPPPYGAVYPHGGMYGHPSLPVGMHPHAQFGMPAGGQGEPAPLKAVAPAGAELERSRLPDVVKDRGAQLKASQSVESGSDNSNGGREEGTSQNDEREVKRQRRKQSNRESARRSRLRKQAECEELGARVDTLTVENMALRTELARLSEDCKKLTNDQTSLLEELRKHKAEERTASVDDARERKREAGGGAAPQAEDNGTAEDKCNGSNRRHRREEESTGDSIGKLPSALDAGAHHEVTGAS